MDQLHPGTGEFSFNCTGTVASCDWIRIELLLPPRNLATAAAAAPALRIPRISLSLSLFSLLSSLFSLLSSLISHLSSLPLLLLLLCFFSFSLLSLSLFSLPSLSLSLSLSLSSLTSLTSLNFELNDLPFVHPLPLKFSPGGPLSGISIDEDDEVGYVTFCSHLQGLGRRTCTHQRPQSTC